MLRGKRVNYLYSCKNDLYVVHGKLGQKQPGKEGLNIKPCLENVIDVILFNKMIHTQKTNVKSHMLR